jgi:hypothetical protein
MPNTLTLQRSFNGGEVSPEMFGMIEDPKFRAGLALCRNFICRPQGPAENRAGFAFVHEVKDSSKRTRVIPFTYSTTQTMVIEVGAGYFRFHTQGATLLYPVAAAYNGATAYVLGDLVLSGGVTYYAKKSTTGNAPPNATYWYPLPATGEYEIPNNYAEADLFDIHYVQSADVLTLSHPGYPPAELRRTGATNWQLVDVVFGAPISAPTIPTVTTTAFSPPGYTLSYCVTAIAADGIGESVQSPTQTVVSNVLQSGVTVTISWTAVTGALRYNVYKLQGGVFGYIGRTTGLSITDTNIAPDISKTPPIYDSVFGATGDYPAAVSYFEQRRVFAGTTNKPQNIWMTKSGTESNMSYGLPLKDDDRISFRVAAREANAIRHVVPLTQLLMLTADAEWRVSSINSDAITPTTISVRPQSYVGASNVQPVIINNAVIYAANRGGHIHELGYNWQANGFVTGDVSLRSIHLFDNKTIIDMAFSKVPHPTVWCVSSDGKLLGFTYVPDQQVGAWHQHDTDGLFESCCVVAESTQDALYCVVNRTINSVQKRYIERMEQRLFDQAEDAFFVDCGATYNGTATTTISGLGFIEGKTVSILADGAVHPQRVVTSGTVHLDYPASKVHVGLPISADIYTLPVALQVDNAFAQGRTKNVNKVWLRVYRSSGIFAGPNVDQLVEYKQRTTEPVGTPPALKSEEIRLNITPSWGDGGQVYIRQANPLPLTVISLTLEIAVGG